MPNRAADRVDLLRTDAELAAGEMRIVAQTMRVERMRAESREAELLLQAMREAFDAGREHRRQILLALDEPE